MQAQINYSCTISIIVVFTLKTLQQLIFISFFHTTDIPLNVLTQYVYSDGWHHYFVLCSSIIILQPTSHIMRDETE